MCRAYGARDVLYITDPAFTRWANLCRAYGAGRVPCPALSSAVGAQQVSPARKGWES